MISQFSDIIMMMLVKNDGQILPVNAIRILHFAMTNTSLPLFEEGVTGVEEQYIAAGYIPVQYDEKPEVAPYQKLVENEPVVEGDICKVSYRVEHRSDEEINLLRQRAYQTESDSIYMEWLYDQTEEKHTQWKSKVQEIKSRFPKKN